MSQVERSSSRAAERWGVMTSFIQLMDSLMTSSTFGASRSQWIALFLTNQAFVIIRSIRFC